MQKIEVAFWVDLRLSGFGRQYFQSGHSTIDPILAVRECLVLRVSTEVSPKYSMRDYGLGYVSKDRCRLDFITVYITNYFASSRARLHLATLHAVWQVTIVAGSLC